jgi:hypothetical protein
MASVTASTVPHRWRCRTGAGAAGQAGDIRWNFEKFLIAPAGKIAGRFRPQTDPEVPELVAAIESLLPREGRPALSAVRTRPAKGRARAQVAAAQASARGPRLAIWPAMMARWISLVPSQIRSTRTSR